MASLAFVLPFGEPNEALFADTLLCLLAADARRAGHQARVLRVYYHGRDADQDAAIRARLREYLTELDPDLVVVERLFDPEPVLAGGRRALQVTRGDSLEPAAGIRHVLGISTELVPGGLARRSPTLAALRAAFGRILAGLGGDLGAIEGVATLERGELLRVSPLPSGAEEGPFDPVTDADVIAPGAPPAVRHKTLLGNVGCPFSDDPLASAFYAGVALPGALPVARLGCAFCHMGGDYEKRPDSQVVAHLIEQAEYYARHLPDVDTLILSDQHALRYLAALLRSAGARELPARRWLFPARPDAFVRERARVAEAALAAAEVGHVVEVYLSGFEAFSDRELARYGKGCSKAELLDAVAAMRELRAAHPGCFDYARARAHSTILWNPWTTTTDVRESIDAIREHDLGELFHELGRNRLRLYQELPITWAARRDGAVQERWDAGDEGSARRKGYSSELPWRFLDQRTRVAHEVAAGLRDRLGLETELEQLGAALDYAEGGGGGWEACASDLTELERAVARLLAPTRSAEQPARGTQLRAVPCVLRRSTSTDAVRRAVIEAVELARPLLVENPADPRFADVVADARARHVAVAVVCEGEAQRWLLPGVRGLSQRVRVPGAAIPTGVPREVRVRPVADTLKSFPDWASWAVGARVRQLRVEIGLAALGLSNLREGAEALDALAAACRAHDIALEVAPLAAGLGDYRFAPAEKPPPP